MLPSENSCCKIKEADTEGAVSTVPQEWDCWVSEGGRAQLAKKHLSKGA